MNKLSIPMKQITCGNLFLFVCSAFYLLWWLAAFKPVRTASNLVCGVLLGMAFITGIAGLVFAVSGICSTENSANKVSLKILLIGGVICYLLLLLITNLLLKRQVTSELFLITGWAVLELCILDVMYSQNICSCSFAVTVCILIAAAIIGSLICYLIYYHLDDAKRYVDGMIPLITEAMVILVITLKIVSHK